MDISSYLNITSKDPEPDLEISLRNITGNRYLMIPLTDIKKLLDETFPETNEADMFMHASYRQHDDLLLLTILKFRAFNPEGDFPVGLKRKGFSGPGLPHDEPIASLGPLYSYLPYRFILLDATMIQNIHQAPFEELFLFIQDDPDERNKDRHIRSAKFEVVCDFKHSKFQFPGP